MMGLFKEELAALRPELTQGVRCVFTEREGGVSSGPWGGVDGIMGLNVASHVGDNAGCVKMNRQIVGQLTPEMPRWMTQVHGTRVVDAEEVTDDACEADAQVSLTPGVVCAVQVADCLPVLIAEVDGKAVAAVHAGWRSLAGGIVEATVARLRERLGDANATFKAWLGPRIGKTDFVVGAEVKAAFEAAYPDLVDAVVPSQASDKFLLDLGAYAVHALRRVGIEAVDDCGLSTYADAKRLYSYRRDGERTGRHAALIWMDSPRDSE